MDAELGNSTASGRRPAIWLAWLPGLLWASCIFLVSAQPYLEPSAPFDRLPAADWWGHVAIYAVLSFLVARPLRAVHGWSWWPTALVTFLLCITFGATDEWHQRFVPGRNCSLDDWFMDVSGSFAGLLPHWYDTRPSRQTDR